MPLIELAPLRPAMRAGAPLLLFSCGQPDRGDDAIAPWLHRQLAEARRRRGWQARLRLVNRLQWQPEDCLDVVPGGQLVFVDADRTAPFPWRLEPVQLQPIGAPFSHGLTPGQLCWAARLIGAPEPCESWMLGLPAGDFRLGRPPSPTALAAAQQLLKALIALLESTGSGKR